MNTPPELQDLVSDIVHAYPFAQMELDPLPSGVCFLWVGFGGQSFALEYHPKQGTGVSENHLETTPFEGHGHVFNTLQEGTKFLRELLSHAALSETGPRLATAGIPNFHL